MFNLRLCRSAVLALAVSGCASTRLNLEPVSGESKAPVQLLILENGKRFSDSYLGRLVRDPVHLGNPGTPPGELRDRTWNMAAGMPDAQDCRGRYTALPRKISFQRFLLQDFTETELDAAMDDLWRELDDSWRGWRGMINCSDEASLFVVFFEQHHWYQLLHPVRGVAKDRKGNIYSIKFRR